jgi:hypothetical protein
MATAASRRKPSSSNDHIFSDPTLRRFAIVGGIGLIGCVIARAPTIMGKYTVPGLGLELSLNAGYVLMLGPLLLFGGTIWAAYGAGSSSPRRRRLNRFDRFLAAVLFILPFLTAALLAAQFFLLLAPKGECLTFDRLRYLTDISYRAFQPEYCMGVSDEARQGQPWLLQPPIIQGWLQVLLPLAIVAVTARAWQRWRPRT